MIFESTATNLVAGDTNGTTDTFLRDTCNGAPAGCVPSTIRVSVDGAGAQANSFSTEAQISDDGRFVVFVSNASNLVAGDTNAQTDVFLRDTCIGAPAGCVPSTTRVSVNNAGNAPPNTDSRHPSISGNGRFVVFWSTSNIFDPTDFNAVQDVFLRDTCFGGPAGCVPSTIRLSVSSFGSGGYLGDCRRVISFDGRYVAFLSAPEPLLPGDTNGINADVYIALTPF